MSKMKKYIFIILGIASTAIGLIGIVLPILPTTPFLLLAAYFFSKSSERFLHWLLTNKLFGSYIDNYRKGLGIPIKQKIFTIMLLWATISLSAFVFVDSLWVRIMLIFIACAVTLHLVMIKTYRPEKEASQSENLGLQQEIEQ